MSDNLNNTILGSINQIETSYKWALENFSNISTPTGQAIFSPVFTTNLNSRETKWLLAMYPNGYNKESQDYVSLFLQHEDQGTISVLFELAILDGSIKRKSTILDVHTFIKKEGFGCLQFVKRNTLKDKDKKLLIDDKLTILCTIKLDESQESPLVNEVGNLRITSRLKEFDEFERLLDDDKHFDVVLCVNEKKCYAYKGILAARSSVFAAMFKHDMKENQSNSVVIEDIDYEILRELLRFMYTGKVHNIEIFGQKLLIAANKYSVKGLMDLCEESLIDNLSISNCVTYLNLADSNNAADLKKIAMLFIIAKAEALVDEPKFKSSLAELNPDLLSEVMCTVVNKRIKINE